MFERDVRNMTEYYGQYAPELLDTRYALEMWALFEEGDLHENYELTGYADLDTHEADLDAVLKEIQAALEEEEERIERIKLADED